MPRHLQTFDVEPFSGRADLRLSGRYPAARELQRTYRIMTPEILRMADRWLSLWQQSGLKLERGVLAATTNSAVIVGRITEESLALNREPPD